MTDAHEFFKRRARKHDRKSEHALWEWDPADDIDQFPFMSYMLSRRYVEDKLRELGTIIIFCEGGRLKYLVNDKDAALTGFGSLSGLETALIEIERQMAAEEVDWREKRHRNGDRG